MSAQALSHPLLDLRDLHVAFGSKEVVRGVSLQIAAGEKLALVGESGSGKSITAMSLLKLVQQAHVTGQAWFNGLGDQGAKGVRRDLLQLSERELRGVRGRDIAVIFQEPMTALNPLFTIGDQIAEVIELHQAVSKAQAWQRAIELLAQTGIPEPTQRALSFPHQLSGGQRQRAMIAMALALDPKVLIAAELPIVVIEMALAATLSFTLVSPLGMPWWAAVLILAGMAGAIAGMGRFVRHRRHGRRRCAQPAVWPPGC